MTEVYGPVKKRKLVCHGCKFADYVDDDIAAIIKSLPYLVCPSCALKGVWMVAIRWDEVQDVKIVPDA